MRLLPTTIALSVALLTAACGSEQPSAAGDAAATFPNDSPSPESNDPDVSMDDARTTTAGISTPPPEARQPAGQSGQPKGLDINPAKVDDTDLDESSEAVVRTMLSSDTALDQTRTDAYRRASQWMTPDTAEQYTADTTRGTDADWLELEEHDGYTVVTLEDPVAAGQPPGSTKTEGMRAYYATVTPTGRDDWGGTPLTYQAMVVMVRNAPTDPWKAEIINLVPSN